MSYSPTNSYSSFFPTSPASPNAFNLFITSQSPRDAHATYSDLRQALRPSTQYQTPSAATQKQRSSSVSSVKSSLKRFLAPPIQAHLRIIGIHLACAPKAAPHTSGTTAGTLVRREPYMDSRTAAWSSSKRSSPRLEGR
ncbi:hypothetical protein DXG01_003075 [Tephrocybe rancida]|nr:hypothetical protein DXG01_003075 [Tephrocybe rancida]